MKIAVNTRLLLPNKLQGVGRVANEVLTRLVSLLPQAEFHFIFDRKYDPKYLYAKNVIPQVGFPPARHPFLYYLFFEQYTPYLLKKIKPDIYFSPEPFVPLKSKLPKVVVFHDIAYEHFPQGVGKITLAYYKKFFPLFAQNADKILAVSEFTKQDLIKKYNINPQKIRTVYNGVSEIFKEERRRNKEIIQKKYSDSKPYFLYVGSIHPRKNLERLLKAFDLFKQETKAEHKLLLTGAIGWKIQETMKTYQTMKFKDDVLFTGHVSDEELADIYAGAEALCYVSIFEGFGLPVAEAMKSGTPVITSNTSSMKEIGENAALLVNPYEIREIADAMKKILRPEIRAELIQKGKERIKQFSWDKFAETLAETLQKTYYEHQRNR